MWELVSKHPFPIRLKTSMSTNQTTDLTIPIRPNNPPQSNIPSTSSNPRPVPVRSSEPQWAAPPGSIEAWWHRGIGVSMYGGCDRQTRSGQVMEGTPS